MANTYLTPSLIAKETLAILANNLVAAAKVNRQFENQFVKIGQSLTVRKPNRFTVTKGPGLSIQSINEPSTSITVSNQAHVDFQFSSADLTLAIEEFSERYCKPAAETLANQVDFDVITNFNQVYNLLGTAGTAPANFQALGNVGQRMDEGAVPQDGRCLLLSPKSYWSLANGLTTLYVRSVAEPALKGYLANIANFEIYLDQNIQSQTWGALAGTGVVNGAGQTGTQIATNGWTASTTNNHQIGDVVTFAGVNAINPQNRVSTGALQNFVITAASSSDGAGNETLNISPAITTSGAYQTVSGSPANGAAITHVSAPTASTGYKQNLAFVKDAFGLVMVPLEIPQGVDFAARETAHGLSMRIVRAYDINSDVFPCRIDLLYGTATFYPELAARLTE